MSHPPMRDQKLHFLKLVELWGAPRLHHSDKTRELIALPSCAGFTIHHETSDQAKQPGLKGSNLPRNSGCNELIKSAKTDTRSDKFQPKDRLRLLSRIGAAANQRQTIMAANKLLPMRNTSSRPNGFFAARSMVVGLARVLAMTLATVSAAPLSTLGHAGEEPPEAEGASLWVLYVASLVLVLSGGAFAGLTIA